MLTLYLDETHDWPAPSARQAAAPHASSGQVEALLRDALRCIEAALKSDPNLMLEAKSWLVDTVSQLEGVQPSTARAAFLPGPDSGRHSGGSDRRGGAPPRPPLSAAAERQLLALACKARPAAAAALLSSDPEFARGFFSRPGPATVSFFGGIGVGGLHTFSPGAAALANYALAERAECWHLLAWSGKHPQAPVAVAAKPHHFAELDVAATVANLARSCPGFWASRELRRGLEGGGWLELDLDYCSRELQARLHGGSRSWREAVAAELEAAITSCDWRALCQQVMPLMGEADLLGLLRALGEAHFSRRAGRDLRTWAAGSSAAAAAGGGGAAAAPLALAGVEWRDARDALLANALAARGGRLAKLLAGDEGAVAQLARAEEIGRALHGGAGGGGDGGLAVAQRAFLSGLDPASPTQRLLLLLNAWTLRQHLLRQAGGVASGGGGGGGEEAEGVRSFPGMVQALGWCCEAGSGGGRGGGGRGDGERSSRSALASGGAAAPDVQRLSSSSPAERATSPPRRAPAEREPLARGSAPRSGKRGRSASRGRSSSSGGSRSRSRSRSRSCSGSSGGGRRRRKGSSKKRKKRQRREERRRRGARRGASLGGSPGSGDPMALAGGGSGSEDGGGGRAAARPEGAGERGARLGPCPVYRARPPGGGAGEVVEGTAEAVVDALVLWACRRWVLRALEAR